jgi:hypothetical protein
VKSSRCHFGQSNPAQLCTQNFAQPRLIPISSNVESVRLSTILANALPANRLSQKSPTVRSAARMENTWSASVCRLDKPTRTRFCLKPPIWLRPGHPEWIVGKPQTASKSRRRLLDLRGAVQQFAAERNAQELSIRYVSGSRDQDFLSFQQHPRTPQRIRIDKFLNACRCVGPAQSRHDECFDRIALRRQCSLFPDIPRNHFRPSGSWSVRSPDKIIPKTVSQCRGEITQETDSVIQRLGSEVRTRPA